MPKTPTLRNQQIPPPEELCTDPEMTPEEQAAAEAEAIDLTDMLDVIEATGSFQVQ